jgi:hypothetical protein
MRNLSFSAIAAILGMAFCQSVQAQIVPTIPLKGKFVNPVVNQDPERGSFATADMEALLAVQGLKTPIDLPSTAYEYGEEIRKARFMVNRAANTNFADSYAIKSLQSAIDAHALALQFWRDCINARTDFMCDEKLPSVAEVMARYPKPRKIETIAPISVVEALRRYPKPWVATRVRATLREVVEYVPASEQKKVLELLWQKAAQDTKQAAIALGRP